MPAPSQDVVAAAAPAAPSLSATQLIDLPLHADVSDDWKLEKEGVMGGSTLRTLDDMVTITKDPVPGVKKDTLEDEKQRVDGVRQDEKEETLGDGWLWSYKRPGLFPYDAVVYRTIGTMSYRCLVSTSTAARQREGIAICKSLRP